MLSVPEGWGGFVSDVKAAGIRHVAFRWYFPTRSRSWASDQGRRFSEWLLQLKAGDPRALNLFIEVLGLVWQPDDPSEWAIGAAPASAQGKQSPLRTLTLAATGQSPGVTDLSPDIQRIFSLPSGRRNVDRQFTSIAFPRRLPPAVRHVLLIDDIWTSGSTLKACARGIRTIAPNVEITTFAFGKTQRTGSTTFPSSPWFPALSEGSDGTADESLVDPGRADKVEIGDEQSDGVGEGVGEDEYYGVSGYNDEYEQAAEVESDQFDQLLLCVASDEDIQMAKARLTSEVARIESEYEIDDDGDLRGADARVVRILQGSVPEVKVAGLLGLVGESWVLYGLTASASSADLWLRGDQLCRECELWGSELAPEPDRIDEVFRRHLLALLMRASSHSAF